MIKRLAFEQFKKIIKKNKERVDNSDYRVVVQNKET